MIVTAGVLTWNPISNNRLHLLEETVGSLADADRVFLFDNGSTDEYSVEAERVNLPQLRGFPHGNTCGYGMNKMARRLDGDVVIMSNDDIVWKPGAVDTLRRLWTDAPDDLAVISGLVEPTYALPGQKPWNEPLATLDYSGLRLLVRRSVPGGAWTFRREFKDRIFPVSTFNGTDDVPACHRLVSEGYRVACIDLAEHRGVESTWGNGSERFLVTPLDDVRATFGLVGD